MGVKFRISETHYEELSKNPFIFLRYHQNIQYDDKGQEIDYSKWKSIDRDLNIDFPARGFSGNQICLAITSNAEKDKDNPEEYLITINFVSGTDKDEWTAIFNCFIANSNDSYFKRYSYLELIWSLNHLNWTESAITECLRSYPEPTRIFLLSNLTELSRCLSLPKQRILNKVFDSLGHSYAVFFHPIVSELYPGREYKGSLNLFELIDRILERPFNAESLNKFNDSNHLIALYKWLKTNEPLKDYEILKGPIFALVSNDIRLTIIRRYFHDIRNGHTLLDLNILTEMRKSKYADFIRYRYCIETPTEPIVLLVPLLCDSLITLYNSQGQAFQTFDGVLDFAIQNCDPNHPNINFHLNRILPSCNENGAVYNDSFKGFINYSIVVEIDQNLLTEEILEHFVRQILDSYCTRKKYFACSHDDNRPIDDTTLQKCNKFNYNCLIELPYDSKWEFKVKGNEKKIDIINSFLDNPIEDSKSKDTIEIDWGMISTSRLKEYIVALPHKFEKVSDNEFLIQPNSRHDQEFELSLVERFGKKLRMRFCPNGYALAGLKFDIFGIRKKIYNTLSIPMDNINNSPKYNEAEQEYHIQEALEVRRRTSESLQRELNVSSSQEGFFEIPFDQNILNIILSKYYYKSTLSNSNDISEREFLKAPYLGGFVPLCAPSLADNKNLAIDLPYFWCRGKECFHNNLANQKLTDNTDWHSYSLFHLIEIMGYPKLRETEAGWEPDEVVRQFINTCSRVMQKFRRLKCRLCGHLLFTGYSLGFNRYNYFGCANPNCKDFRNFVYLNFCYKCKVGLIDSRDSKQCPHRWYICPSCLSCCDDDQFERIAQKYILIGMPVPQRIQSLMGLGHNNNGYYFCPQCGAPVENIDDGNETYKYCSKCDKKFYPPNNRY